jgi:hypothetical protein
MDKTAELALHPAIPGLKKFSSSIKGILAKNKKSTLHLKLSNQEECNKKSVTRRV